MYEALQVKPEANSRRFRLKLNNIIPSLKYVDVCCPKQKG